MWIVMKTHRSPYSWMGHYKENKRINHKLGGKSQNTYVIKNLYSKYIKNS